MTAEGRGRLWTFAFIVIVACSLFSFLMGQSANSGTSVYLDRMGEATGLAGIGAIVFSFAAAAGRIATGPAVDSIGRAVFMTVGAVVMLAGSCGPFFDEYNAFFIVWRTLQGLGFSICTTACATAAADVLPIDRLGEGIGYYGLGQAISMTVGPALAIFLISTDYPQSFYIVLTLFSVCALLCALMCRYERNPESLPEDCEFRMRHEGRVPAEQPEEGGSRGNARGSDIDSGQKALLNGNMSFSRILDSILEPKALAGAVPMMFISVAYGFGIFFIGVFGSSIGASYPGVFFTVAAVTMIAVRVTSGSFMDKVRPIVIMGVAVVCALIVYGMLIVSQSIGSPVVSEWLYYIAGLFYGVSIGVAIPINQSVAVKVSPPDRWGAANGLFLLANDVAIGVASLVCGITLQEFGYAPTLLGVMACVAISFFMALKLYPKDRI